MLLHACCNARSRQTVIGTSLSRHKSAGIATASAAASPLSGGGVGGRVAPMAGPEEVPSSVCKFGQLEVSATHTPVSRGVGLGTRKEPGD